MILTTEKPICFEFNIPEYRLVNQEYEVSLFTATGYKPVYKGLTFFNNDGLTRIFVDRILRDYIYVNEIDFTDIQTYNPTNLITSTETVLEPVETTGKFITTVIRVQILNSSAPVSERIKTKEITCVGNAFYETPTFTLRNPYEGNYMFVNNYSTYNKVVSHLPDLLTNELWLGLVFCISKGVRTAKVSISNGKKDMLLKRSTYGNYSTSIPLSLLKNVIQYKGGDTLMLNTDLEIPLFPTVAKIDKCPADFYVVFTTNYSWTCLPFKGNIYINNNADNVVIEDYLGMKKVVSNLTHCSFNLYTEYLDLETYNTLMGILGASNIYVFDTKHNKGTWCVVKNSSFDGLPSKTKKPKYFNLQLTEASNLKS